MSLDTDATTLDDILGHGRWIVLREEAGVREAWLQIRAAVLDGIAVVCGDDARRRVDRDGLGRLHEVLAAEDIGALRDAVMPVVRPLLLTTACRVAREVLGIEGEFYVDDYTILRVNFPYEVALQASRSAENPGIGRVSQTVRDASVKARVIDPVYDPRGYHRDQPPAAWAHGPHLDTWTGHSRDGVNLWWAVSDVLETNGMFFYPELFGTPLDPDPRSLYLAAGQPLPRPTPMPMAEGELLVFNPEVLHGTYLNVSGRTRVAASTRINARAPRFDPTCFYAREFWHVGTRLEAGDRDDVRRFPRDEHLAEPPEAAAPPQEAPARVTLALSPGDASWNDVCAAQALSAGGRMVVQDDAGAPVWMIVRTPGGLRAVGAVCPHLGMCLEDGFQDGEAVHCPAHALRFSLDTGTSVSPILRLPTADVRERAGRIELRVP